MITRVHRVTRFHFKPSREFGDQRTFRNNNRSHLFSEMDPNKSGGSFTGGLVNEVGENPLGQAWYFSWRVLWKEWDITDAKRRLEWYLNHNGYNLLRNMITIAKTANQELALCRLQTFATVANELFEAYANRQSRSDRWRVILGKRRALHRMTRKSRSTRKAW